jgi:Fe-S cluster assembly protein SufD
MMALRPSVGFFLAVALATGQIDEEAIFYLQSRGVSRKNAINLMITAFVKDTLKNISILPLKNYIDQKIEDRFVH